MDATAPSVGNVAGNMLATIVGNFFPPVALLVSAPILTHALGVAGRGQLAGATAPLMLVTTAATFGVPQALTYVVARNPAVLRRASRSALWLIAGLGAAATLAVVLGAHWLSAGNTTIAKLITVASFAIVPSLLLAVLRGAASGLHLWRKVAFEQVLSSTARLVALVPLLVVHQLTPLSATIVTACTPLVGALSYRHLQHGATSAHAQGGAEVVPLSFLVNYGLRIWVGAVSGILLSRLDQTIMVPLANEYQLGLYAVAVTVSTIPLVINSAVRDVTFSADASQNMDSRLSASARISSSASAGLGLFVGVTMIWWLPWLFGRDFRPAVGVAAVLIIAVVLGTPGSIAGAGLSARGRPGLRSTSLVIACLINVVVLLSLVPRYGAMGAAYATLVGNLIAANLNIILLWRIYGISPREFYGLRASDIRLIQRFLRSLTHALSTASNRRR